MTAELDTMLTEHDAGAFDLAALAELDERDAFPEAAVRVLDDAGLPAHYILDQDTDFRHFTWLIRTVARRDLTVAIAHAKTFLGAAPVWIAGTAAQVAALAEHVRAGQAVCWGLTEREHGADLLAGEFRAAPVAGGWQLDGEKWLINNATRARFACVLARTGEGGRGFSLFLVDRDQLPAAAWRPLPKVRTHGIRGADISGFTASRAVVAPEALVGEAGDGVPSVLKTLQLTRIMCCGLSLGAGEHALAVARDFVAERRLYDRTLADLPHVRRILGRAATSLLIAEAVSLLATRSVHALPGELSATSAIAKAFVPTLVQDMLSSVAELLGVRGFLTAPPAGPFAKLERDHRIVGIFDGSTVVNRTALLTQLPRLHRALRRGHVDTAGVRAAADLATPVAPFDRERLALTSAAGCSVVQALPAIVERVRESGPPELVRLAELAAVELDRLAADAADFVPVAGGLPASAFQLAERYECAYAAAACLVLWLENVDAHDGPLWTEAWWPTACLEALLGAGDSTCEAMASVVLGWSGREFSLLAGAV